jgi:ABC-type transport system substrate-binding protein
MTSCVRRGPAGLAIALVLVWVVAIGVSAQAQSQTPQRGGTIVVAIGGEPPHLNPQFTTLPWVWMIGMAVNDSLVKLDRELKPHPNLAESWTVSSDYKTYTFRLRRGISHPRPSSTTSRRSTGNWVSTRGPKRWPPPTDSV